MLAEALESDPEARALLDREAAEWRRANPGETLDLPQGARAERIGRGDAVLRAIDALVLAGELAPDGPGRVRLPGFGPGTWRAVVHLRGGQGGPLDRWARAVAAEPVADLGPAAPAFLRDLDPDPELAEPARRLHAWEARRQDARDALLRALAAEAVADERRLAGAARTIREERAMLEAEIDRADVAIAAIWLGFAA